MTVNLEQCGSLDGVPLFSAGALGELLGIDDSALFIDFYTTFLGQLSSLVPDLKSYAQSGDVGGLRETSHKLKSSSRTVGAMRLSSALEEMEQAARDGSLPLSVQWIGPVADLVDITTAAVRNEIIRLGGKVS